MELDALHRLVRGTGRFPAPTSPSTRRHAPALNARLKRLPAVAGVASPAQTAGVVREPTRRGPLHRRVLHPRVLRRNLRRRHLQRRARRALGAGAGAGEPPRARLLAARGGRAPPRRAGAHHARSASRSAGGSATSSPLPSRPGSRRRPTASRSSSTRRRSRGPPSSPSSRPSLSGSLVRRRLDRMDLIEVLKTRE